MSKTTKLAMIISIATLIALIVTFFIIWGVAQMQLAKIAHTPMVGKVEQNNWSATDDFKENNYHSFTVPEGRDFNMLAMTDLHYSNDGWYASPSFWGGATANRNADKHVKTLVDKVKPDFIVLTGDVQTGSLNDLNYRNLCLLMDSFKVPWTVTFGNHDGEHRADKPYLVNIMAESEYCIFDIGPTNLGTVDEPQAGGLGNTVVNLKRPSGEVYYSLIMTDTGDWQNMPGNMEAKKRGEHAYSRVGVGWTDRQIEWYEWVLRGVEKHNKSINTSSSMPKSMLLQHIPSKVYEYAVMTGDFNSSDPSYTHNDVPFATEAGWARPQDGKLEERYNQLIGLFYNRINKSSDIEIDLPIVDVANMTLEDVRAELVVGYELHKANDLFMAKVKALGSTDYMVTGHNHCDGFEARLDGISYVSVVKTTDIYVHTDWDMGNRGGTQILITNDNGSAKVVTKAQYVKVRNVTSNKYPR